MEQDIYFANNTMVGNGPATGTAQTGTVQATEPQAEAPAEAPSFWAGGNMQLLLTMTAVFAVMYFFTIRPQKKREQQIKEMQSGIRTGDWVVTFSGMYGKAVDVGAEVVMVEFGSNKSVRIPVKKSELTKTTEPSLFVKKDDTADE